MPKTDRIVFNLDRGLFDVFESYRENVGLSRDDLVALAIQGAGHPSRRWSASWAQRKDPSGKVRVDVRVKADCLKFLVHLVNGSRCTKTCVLNFAVQRLLAAEAPDAGLDEPESAQEESDSELREFLIDTGACFYRPEEHLYLLPKGSLDPGVLPSEDHSIRLVIEPDGSLSGDIEAGLEPVEAVRRALSERFVIRDPLTRARRLAEEVLDWETAQVEDLSTGAGLQISSADGVRSARVEVRASFFSVSFPPLNDALRHAGLMLGQDDDSGFRRLLVRIRVWLAEGDDPDMIAWVRNEMGRSRLGRDEA